MEKRLPREGAGLTEWDIRQMSAKAAVSWKDLAKSVREIHPVWKMSSGCRRAGPSVSTVQLCGDSFTRVCSIRSRLPGHLPPGKQRVN